MQFITIPRLWSFVALAAFVPGVALADLAIIDHPVNNDVVDLYTNAGTPVNPGNPTLTSLLFATGVTFGPGGQLYVDTADPQSVGNSGPLGSVFKYGYNPATGGLTSTNLFVQYDGTPTSVFNPQGMKFGPNGDLYIADEGGNGVAHLYNSTGSSVTTLLPAGIPTAVAFSPAGNLYTSTSQGIEEYSTATNSFSTVVLAATGSLTNPTDLTFGPDGKLYVLDLSAAGPTVFRYNADGSSQNAFITFPDFQPSNFAFGPDGLLYISGYNTNNFDGKVLRYNANGSFDDEFISGLSNPGFLAFTNVPEPVGMTGVIGAILLLRRRRA